MTKSGIKKKKDFVFSFILNYLQNPFVPREGIVCILIIILLCVSWKTYGKQFESLTHNITSLFCIPHTPIFDRFVCKDTTFF